MRRFENASFALAVACALVLALLLLTGVLGSAR